MTPPTKAAELDRTDEAVIHGAGREAGVRSRVRAVPRGRRRLVLGAAVVTATLAVIGVAALGSQRFAAQDMQPAGDLATVGAGAGAVEGSGLADDLAGGADAEGAPAREAAGDEAAGREPGAADVVDTDDVAGARSALAGFLRASDRMLARSPLDPGALDALTTPAMLGEIEATVFELDAAGLRQQGEVRIASLSASDVDMTSGSAQVVIEACLDTAGVSFVDTAGRPAGLTDGSPTLTLHRYGLVRGEGRWLVATHGFPDDPDC